MKHTTFYISNNSNNSSNSFLTDNTNYSKILDDIIATNIKKSNPYLNTIENNDDFYSKILKASNCSANCCSCLKNDEFIKAANFLANYKKNKTIKKLPFIFGKTYKLIDGTPIIFYDDEIQIGFDLYSYSNFGDTLFLKSLTPTTKKLIINIFTTGTSNININIL